MTPLGSAAGKPVTTQVSPIMAWACVLVQNAKSQNLAVKQAFLVQWREAEVQNWTKEQHIAYFHHW